MLSEKEINDRIRGNQRLVEKHLAQIGVELNSALEIHLDSEGALEALANRVAEIEAIAATALHYISSMQILIGVRDAG